VELARAGAGSGTLQPSLDRTSFALEILRKVADRLSVLGGDGKAFFRRTVAGPLTSLVRQSLGSRARMGRAALVDSLAMDIVVLKDAQLLDLLPAADLAAWVAEALLRAREEAAPPVDPASPSYSRYRALRGSMPPATLAFTLVDLLGRLPVLHRRDGDLDEVVRGAAALVRGFSDETRAQLLARDLAYLEVPIVFFERWWHDLSLSLPADPTAALEALMESQFFSITHDESALARFDLEAQLMALVFEDAGIAAIRERIARLYSTSSVLVERLAVQRVARIGREAPRAQSA